MKEYKIGTKVQRKGSKVIWTVIAGRVGDNTTPLNFANTEIHVSCQPKNRHSEKHDWIPLESFEKNWVEV